MNDLNVCMIYGGWSSERDVSIASADKIRPYLSDLSYNFHEVELTKNREWVATFEDKRHKVNPITFLKKIDVALLLLHGIGGEDGVIQGFLEAVGVPYTGPGVTASSIFIDKIVTKHQFLALGVNTPKYLVCSKLDSGLPSKVSELWESAQAWGRDKVVVKPACGGSSFGASLADSEISFKDAIVLASGYDHRIIVEEFVSGIEVQVGLLGPSEKPQVLPTLELVFKDGQSWFDPQTKYGYDRSRVDFRIPAAIPRHSEEYICRISQVICKQYQLEGYGRLDFIIPEEGLPYVLEVNTITGMTPASTYPLMAAKAGLSYAQLIQCLIELAVERTQKII